MKKRYLRATAGALLVWLLAVPVLAVQQLIPVGRVIGLELTDGTVHVAAFADPMGQEAREAGLRIGDEIVAADDRQISHAEDLKQALARSDGSVELTVRRKGKCCRLKLHPVATASGPKLGVYLKEGISGIGTVTWYDPASHRFGALGHGINQPDGSLAEMVEGTAYSASVEQVQRGKAGTPGLLKGRVDTQTALGTLYANTARGVFGTTQEGWRGQALPVAEADRVHTGAATILSNVRDQQVREFSVEILKLYPKRRADGRNLLLRVTDPELLSQTGGIVQGMSGSPILQDGYLVGAVTHVLVNDQTMGYGILIENMLDAAA